MDTLTRDQKMTSVLGQTIQQALETYSNVHRGSGYRSEITTRIFEEARKIVLDYLGLSPNKYTVIFCSPRRAAMMIKLLKPGEHEMLSSEDFNLPLGLRAMAIKKHSLPKGIPFETGGGSTKLIATDWVIWADAPDKFEAGTPSVINTIVFANYLKHIKPGIHDTIKNDTSHLTAKKILHGNYHNHARGLDLLEKLAKSLVGEDLQVPTETGLQEEIYLDNSASTPSFLPAVDAYKDAMWLNENQRAAVVEEVKSIIADMINAPGDRYDILFTSNTTESINVVAKGLINENNVDIEPVILNTILEHSSNDLPWRDVKNHSLLKISVDDNGIIDFDALDKILKEYNQDQLHGKKRIDMVAMNGASNVLGTCNDLALAGKIVKNYGAELLVDAAQLIAHKPVDVLNTGIDYLAFSAHKIYAPFGCGVLVVRKGLLKYNHAELKEIKLSGEENSAGIAALGRAMVLLKRVGMDTILEEERKLTKYTLEKLLTVPGIKLYGIKDPGSSLMNQRIGVLSFDLKNKFPSKVAKTLSNRGGIGVRYGCHCAHIIVKHVLHVPRGLEQFQRVIQLLFPATRFPGVVRISLGIGNTRKDIDRMVQVLHGIVDNSDKKNVSMPEGKLDKKTFQVQKDNFIRNKMAGIYS